MPIKKSFGVLLVSLFLSAGAVSETYKIVKTLDIFGIMFQQEKPPFTLWIWLIISLICMAVAYVSYKITFPHHN